MVAFEVEADIDQVSVISLETFRSTVRFPVERYFLTHGGGDSDEDIDVIRKHLADGRGIIAFAVAQQADARQIAVDHCAYYGKVAKFLAVQAYEGGYISFSCRWVPYGADARPLVTRY